MKYKSILTILFILILLLSIMLVDYFQIEKKEEKVKPIERTKIEYIMGDISYPQALKKGEDYFLETIKLLRGETLEFNTDNNGDDIIYEVEKVNGYKLITNYSLINKFLSHEAIETFNNEFQIKYYENKYYIKNYYFEPNNNYVGSILNITTHDEEYINFNVLSYYCEDGEFVGILKEKPTCKIIDEKQTNYSLIKESNLLKVNDINEFLGTKKIY